MAGQLENRSIKRIAVKVGSNVLTKEDGKLNIAIMAHLVDEIAALRTKGVEVILISSGAVAAGRSEIDTTGKMDNVSERQLYSAVGQVKLIRRYSDLFKEHGLTCAQILTTKENFSDRGHYLNMKNCFDTLLEQQVIPIVNENDTISVEELMFTDNDELSGLIASMTKADMLLLLTNVDGLYTGDPSHPDSVLIDVVTEESTDLEKYIQPLKSTRGRGGMATKFSIAKKMTSQGVDVVIGSGLRHQIIQDIVFQNPKTPYTWFQSNHDKAKPIRRWLAHSYDFAQGAIKLNHGAKMALHSNEGVSVLPIGVIEIVEPFETGEIIKLLDEAGQPIGIGKANYDAHTLTQEMGQKDKKPIVHCDYLSLNL
ncbi:glutamate 5-kinase [Halosquirtibacter xylanolyticus]|uniref:glutamate 5-kinase n=1 Tax=Halosquirtibacter xylanolyticus TaxID=3374599 RepID=UPI003749BFC1|nr:glutamate 5-kinase [Prolixibacteraceae bacterium]